MLKRLLVFLLFFSTTVLIAQNDHSVSLEHFINTGTNPGQDKNFKYKIGYNIVGYQFRAFDHFYVKPQIGGRFILTPIFQDPSQVVLKDKFSLLYGLDARYDMFKALTKRDSRLKIMPFFSLLGAYYRNKEISYVYSKISFYGGLGVDFKLIKNFGLTSSYRYNFTEYVIDKNVFQIGVNYSF